jgi:hypothetical protein
VPPSPRRCPPPAIIDLLNLMSLVRCKWICSRISPDSSDYESKLYIDLLNLMSLVRCKWVCSRISPDSSDYESKLYRGIDMFWV